MVPAAGPSTGYGRERRQPERDEAPSPDHRPWIAHRRTNFKISLRRARRNSEISGSDTHRAQAAMTMCRRRFPYWHRKTGELPFDRQSLPNNERRGVTIRYQKIFPERRSAILRQFESERPTYCRIAPSSQPRLLAQGVQLSADLDWHKTLSPPRDAPAWRASHLLRVHGRVVAVVRE